MKIKGVAQLVERRHWEPEVAGSSPATLTIKRRLTVTDSTPS